MVFDRVKNNTELNYLFSRGAHGQHSANKGPYLVLLFKAYPMMGHELSTSIQLFFTR